jgi:hypothetical protein
MAAVFIQVAFFYPSFQKFLQLHKSGSENLIIWLNELIETLENFIKAYRRYIAWGIPLGGLLGASIQLMDTKSEIPVPTIDFEPNVPAALSILILLGFAVVLFGATYWLAYYTVKKLYSKYLDGLKASREELMKEN